MTPDEARSLFSEALDGELSAEQADAFDQALAADAELAEEYAAFRQTLALTRQVGSTPPPPIDVLPAVQRKLRQRSHGRFYRDRYAERHSTALINPLGLGLLMVALMGLSWLAFELYTSATVPSDAGRPLAGPTAPP